MNLVAKIKGLQAQIDELRAKLDALPSARPGYAYGEPFTVEVDLDPQPFMPLTPPIEPEVPIETATIAQPPAKRRGRPPKVKPDGDGRRSAAGGN